MTIDDGYFAPYFYFNAAGRTTRRLPIHSKSWDLFPFFPLFFCFQKKKKKL
jgi:hypothetical protein